MYGKHPNHTYGRNRNKSASNQATTALVVIVYSDGVTFFSFFFTARKKRSVFFIPGLRRRKPTRNAMTLTVVTSSLL
jgi:hypothetical protein